MSAIISACGLYRYRLERNVGLWGKQATFVMLNPSTADAERDDATIRRCIGFARAWNCGRLVVVNLFAYRATKPEAMKMTADPVGPENDHHIVEAAREAARDGGRLICAWGANGKFRDRDKAVLAMLRSIDVEPLSLEETADGSPKHPLYIPSDARPLPYLGRA